MNMRLRHLLSSFALLMPLSGIAATTSFSFGVIARPHDATTSTTALKEAITQTDSDNLAFVVTTGIKANDEPCSDDIYQQRHDLFQNAKNGLIVSLAASDWAHCLDIGKRSIAVERINHIRETFFNEEFSFGDSKLPLIHQSAIPSFRIYAENMQWRIHDVLFATINLPSNNNNFLNAAGRDNEYEDRQVANSDWLKRLFIMAHSHRLKGIVLFTDANPLAHRERSSGFFSDDKREGFANIRRQLAHAAKDYQGRILIVHGDHHADRDTHPQQIVWKGNIGALRIDPLWTRIRVNPAHKQLFSVSHHANTFDSNNRQTKK